MVDLLQGPRTPSPIGRTTTDEDERRTVDPGARHGAHGVGDARAGRDGGESRCARELAHRFRGEDCGLLMAYVDESHGSGAPGLHRCDASDSRVVQREDVCPRQREEVLHTVTRGSSNGLGSSVLRLGGAVVSGHRMASASTLTPRATSATIAVTVISVLFCTVLPSMPAGYRAR